MKTITIGSRVFTVLFPDLLRPLSAGERLGLSGDIEARGEVVVPVVVDESDGVIDGINRLEIAEELEMESVPVEVRRGLTDKQKRDLAQSLNEHRRHLTVDDRKALAIQMRQDGKSYREIGERLGVGEATARRDIDESTASNGAVQPNRVIGRDGKSRPASRSRPKGDGPRPKVESPKDQQGKEIPDNLRRVFADGWISDTSAAIDQLLAQVRGIRAQAERKSEQYPYMPISLVLKSIDSCRADLEIVRDKIAEAKPFAVCPKCNGGGCKICEQAGWLARNQMKDLKSRAKL